ncbi:hypothetical protein Ade02nite_14420 [Paractinoplanes deccanensis]|uniref:Uncharacterized protein n=1 Tax=Paractinoplanes deccanensis TaxID=113561 RepID=A0ABQ3XYH6_9ACTN|nr:hypothetical protein [Actinoplanes deccanensis]GID72801.1 hypothetical protein Ade02nite_14420 [Actinoplanes deccanensis]
MHPSTAAGDPAAAAATPVRAGWALFGKHAGQTMDYTILDGSVGPVMAEQYIRLGLTAHADDEAVGRPEALPWLSFVGTAGDPAAACCVMRVDWSDRRDGTGQVVTPTRLLLIPWDEAARTRTTFTDQARAMQLIWEEVNGTPHLADREGVALPLQPDHAEVSGAALDQVGPEWAAGVAALLLEGRQVVIAIDRAAVSLGRRLRYLDAVFGLLPYAYRARLSAATWASYRVKHTIRLSVAERGVAGQIEVLPDRQPAEPQSPEAGEYLRILRALLAKGLTWRQIVAHLAQQGDPARCREASDAVDLLAAMDLSSSVYREIVNGFGSAVRVAHVLDTFGWEGFETPDRQRVVAAFLAGAAAGGDAEAQTVLATHWSADPVMAEVHARVHADIGAGRVDPVRVWFALAQRHGPRWPQAMLISVTRMVVEHPTPLTVQGWLRLLADPPAGTDITDAEIHRQFIARYGAAATLLSTYPFDAEGMAALDGLCDLWLTTMKSQPSWVSPVIAAVKGRSQHISAPLVETLRDHWPGGVPYVLDVAVATGHFETVIVPMFPALAAAMVQSPDHEASVLATLHRLLESRAPLSPASQGFVDALLLIGEGRAPYLHRSAGRPQEAYLAALGNIRLPVVEQRRRAVMDSLLAVLTTDATTADGVRRIVSVVNEAATDLLDRVERYVNEYCLTHPDEIGSLHLGPQWRARLDSSILRYKTFADHCRGSARGEQIADDLLVLVPHVPAQRLLATLQQWIVPDREYDTFLVRRILLAHAVEDDRIEDFARHLMVAIVQGVFSGSEPYANWVRAMADASRSELDHLKKTERQVGRQRPDQRGRSWKFLRW